MSIFEEYNEFFSILWFTDDNGNKISIQRLNEQQKIINGKILLNNIPDQFYKIQIANMYEVNINIEITDVAYFKTNYLTGEVYFHSSLEGQTITIAQYYGRGIIKYMGKRIELQNEENLYDATNVEDFATDITRRVNNIIINAGDSNIEIVDARYNSSIGKTYTTLKNRLDDEYNNFTSYYGYRLIDFGDFRDIANKAITIDCGSFTDIFNGNLYNGGDF